MIIRSFFKNQRQYVLIELFVEEFLEVQLRMTMQEKYRLYLVRPWLNVTWARFYKSPGKITIHAPKLYFQQKVHGFMKCLQ